MTTRSAGVGPLVGLGLLLAAGPARAEETVIPLVGQVPDDGLDHFFVEFELPAGIVEIEVRHDDLSPINVLDWGLDDPDGFRGWGGGNAEPAVVGPLAASRSYVPGPLPAGTWAVVVGKARIDDPPGQYSIEVVLRDAAETPTLAPQPERMAYAHAPALVDEPRWYAGDFHVHSRESGDARPDLDEIATLARESGLDFVVISDHNTHTGQDFFADAQGRNPDVLLVPGVEFTTYAGHANGIGATIWVDHKLGQPGVTIEGAAQAYRDQGALFAINHPALDLGPLCIGCAWEHALDPGLVDAVEIATGGLEPFAGQFSAPAILFWDDLCATGHHVTAIGGSDDHKAGVDLGPFESPLGNATTMVYAERLDVPSIVDGVHAARTVVKLQGPQDPMVVLSVDAELDGDTIRADTAVLTATITGADGQHVRLVRGGNEEGLVAIAGDPAEVQWELVAPAQGQERIRAEIFVDGDRRVVTSHLWLEAGEPMVPGTSTGDGASSGATSGAVDEGTGPAATDTGPPPAAAGDDAGGCGCRSASPGAPFVLALVVLAGLARTPRRRQPVSTCTCRPASAAPSSSSIRRTRPVATSSSWSSRISTSHTCVRRPRWTGRARPTSVPPRVARRKDVLFSSPTVVLPVGSACMAAPTEHSVSTIDACTPPCTSP
jgi:MYXO-CTERM domain-containing protein